MSNLCNLNGEIVPEEDARISIMDRGFLFGDSIYEVIRTRQGVPFAWPEHLQRLHASAAGLQMELGLTDRELTQRIVDTLAAAGDGESYVRIIITRGPGSVPNIDVKYALGEPSCIVMVRTLPPPLPSVTKLAIVPRLRTDRRSLDPAIKSGNYLNNVMGLKEAQAHGATDCLLMNQDGQLTEASTSNVWIVTGDCVATPALPAGLLAGVTRRLLLDMCAEQGINCVEKDLFKEDIRRADGMFLTSTMRDVWPVNYVDGEALPGCPLLDDVLARFTQFCDRRTQEVYRPGIEAMLADPD